MQRKQRGEEPTVGAKQECDLAVLLYYGTGTSPLTPPLTFPAFPSLS